MPSSIWSSARASYGLVAAVLVASSLRGQALATGDLGTATLAPIAARSTVALGVPLVRGSAFQVEAGVDGAGWLRAAGAGRGAGMGYAAGTLRIGWVGRGGASRAWLGVGSGPLWDAAGAHALFLTGLGSSLTWGPVKMEVSLTETRLAAVERTVTVPSAVPIDTLRATPATGRALVGGGVWHGVRAEVNWSGGPIDARLTGGTELRQGEARASGWLRTEATGWLTPQVGLVVGVGSRSPPVLEARPPSGPFTLALRLAFGRAGKPLRGRPGPPPANSAFETRAVAGDLRLLRVRVPHAQRVELTADFVEWRVVSLAPAGGGVWETRLPIRPGRYRVSIRSDGGPWVVPPGLPAVADDFTGAAGLLRIE